MEWIPKAMLSKGSVSPAELKICELCGTLNHETNRECFTCGWHGRFVDEPATTKLAWQRLFHQHEGVLIEHVTARSAAVVDEFGRARQTNRLQRIVGRLRDWLKNTFGGRRVRATPRVDTRQPAAPQTDL